MWRVIDVSDVEGYRCERCGVALFPQHFGGRDDCCDHCERIIELEEREELRKAIKVILKWVKKVLIYFLFWFIWWVLRPALLILCGWVFCLLSYSLIGGILVGLVIGPAWLINKFGVLQTIFGFCVVFWVLRKAWQKWA